MGESERRKQIANFLLNKTADTRILSYRAKAPAADDAHVNSLKVGHFWHHILFCLLYKCNIMSKSQRHFKHGQ